MGIVNKLKKENRNKAYLFPLEWIFLINLYPTTTVVATSIAANTATPVTPAPIFVCRNSEISRIRLYSGLSL